MDPMMIVQTEFYQKLKPQLQNQVLDIVFKNFYDLFSVTFENCDPNFRREVISNCIFTVR
jgi:hypothetical protein